MKFGADQSLTVTTAPVGRAALVTVSGPVDMHTAPRLQDELRGALAAPSSGPVVVDLTAVTFLGSAGLAVLVDAQHEAGDRQRSLALVVDHFRPAVVRPLEAAGLAGLFKSYAVLDDALAGES